MDHEIMVDSTGAVSARHAGTGELVTGAAAQAIYDARLATLERARLDALTVTRFQARAALHQAGKLAEVEAAIAAADELTQMAWAEATTFRRGSPMIAGFVAGGLFSAAELDALFSAAAAIEV